MLPQSLQGHHSDCLLQQWALSRWQHGHSAASSYNCVKYNITNKKLIYTVRIRLTMIDKFIGATVSSTKIELY